MRRILRIWPLYFLVFFGLVLLNQFLPYAGAKDPASWLAFTFFAGNWWICLHGWIPAYPVNPLWSISVEEQFYIAIPFIARYCRRLGAKIISLFLITVSYGAVVLYAMHPTNGFSSQWTNSFVQFQFFAAGTLLSIYLKGRVPQWRPALRLVAALAGIGCWLVASITFGVQADTPHSTAVQAPIGWALVLAGTLLLFLSMLGFPSKYLPRPIVYLGRISYGLYLFHELVYWLIFSPGKEWLTRRQPVVSSRRLARRRRNSPRFLPHCPHCSHVVSAIRKAIPAPQEPLHCRSLTRRKIVMPAILRSIAPP